MLVPRALSIPRGAAIVLMAGLLLSGLVGWRVHLHRVEAAVQELADTGRVVTAEVESTLSETRRQLQALRGFFAASEEVTPSEFARYATAVGPTDGMVALGYARWVPTVELDEAVRTEQTNRSFFRLQSLGEAVAPSGRHLVVWHAATYRTMPRLVGLDLSSDPTRLEAIQRLSGSAALAISNKVEVPGHTQLGLEFYQEANGESDAVVFATLLVDDLMQTQLTEVGRESLTADLRHLPPGELLGSQTAPGHWVGTVAIGPERFALDLHAPRDPRPWGAAIGAGAIGVVISVLAAAATAFAIRSRQRTAELETLTQLAHEKDVFLATVAHELRTPLTAVVGLTQVADDEWEELSEEERHSFLHTAAGEALELADLIEDLLAAGRVASDQLSYASEVVDLESQIDRVAARLTSTATIEIRVSPEAERAIADPLRVRQIFRNLMVNATRYGDSRIEVETLRHGDQVVVEVRNDGPPIPPERRSHLFEAYQGGDQQSTRPGSIGLGLYISRRLATGMGGDLSYERRDGMTVFALQLPAAEATAEKTAAGIDTV